MRKTYSELGWNEVKEALENATRLGLLGEGRLKPVEVEGSVWPDWDLTIEFAGFDPVEVSIPSIRDLIVDRAYARGGIVPREGVYSVADEEADEPTEDVPEAEPAPEEIPEPEIEVLPVPDPEPDPEPETPAIAAEALDPEERSEEEYWQEMKERDEETPPEPAEDTKVCKRCGKEKPLSAYTRHASFADKLDNRCRECRAEMRRTGETSPKGNGGVPLHSDRRREERERAEPREQFEAVGRASHAAPPESEAEAEVEPAWGTWKPERVGPEKRTPVSASLENPSVTVLPSSGQVPELEEVANNPGKKPEKKRERFCRNGTRCVAHQHVGRPTKLHGANKRGICHACEERDSGRFGTGS